MRSCSSSLKRMNLFGALDPEDRKSTGRNMPPWMLMPSARLSRMFAVAGKKFPARLIAESISGE
ncbi:MAG: hypothetical protein ACLPWS_10285 [Rhodomicrobium sp.]